MRVAAALCLVAAPIAGCGAASRDSAKDFKGDERTVATVIENLESSARKSDEARICTRLLAPSLLAALRRQGTNCKTAVREALEDTDSFDLRVDEVTIRAGQATVKVVSGSGSTEKTDTLELRRDGAAWKISSLSG